MHKTAIIALGGNALLRDSEKGTIHEQAQNTSNALKNIVFLVRQGYKIVITHGNGPLLVWDLDSAGCAAQRHGLEEDQA